MKKYIYKTINVFITAIVLSVGTTACSDMLDQKPQGEWTQEDMDGSVQSDIYALYGKLRGSHVTSGTSVLAIHNFRSEDAEKGSNTGDGSTEARMFDNFEYMATNGMIKTYWNEHYSIIHTANDVLFTLATIEEKEGKLSEDNLIQKSEAHFFRAFAYFNLVRAYGDILLIDYPIKDAAEANVAKSPAVKIYELIDKDLENAAKHLPKQWPSKYEGRLTWGAAKALHARTYMMRNDWANMYAASTEVINSNIYNLNTPFDKIFRESEENGSESVFEIQCTATDDIPGGNEIGSEFAMVQGVRGSGEWNLGWGWHTPTQDLADAFEQNDPRKDETLLYFAKSALEASNISPNKPYGEKPIANGDVINKYYNKKAYTDPSLRSKYNKFGYWFNIRIIRYSDVVLMAAESAMEQNKTSEALQYLEMVRARARGANTTILPKVTTTKQNELRSAIRRERRIELAMEWDRFYDLVRWGIAKEVLHAAGKTAYADRNELLPLPQDEVDKSNGVLIQNPNY